MLFYPCEILIVQNKEIKFFHILFMTIARNDHSTRSFLYISFFHYKNVLVSKETSHFDERTCNKSFSSRKITMLHMLKTQYRKITQ